MKEKMIKAEEYPLSMGTFFEHEEEKTTDFGFEFFIDVSLDSNKGVFRRYHVGNNPVNWIDPWGECPATIDTGWKHKTIGPNKATGYMYRAEYKERTTGVLINASGSCSECEDKILYCKYSLAESWYRRTCSYNGKTKKYGIWSEWEGYENRFGSIATLKYSCKEKTFIGGSDYTRR